MESLPEKYSNKDFNSTHEGLTRHKYRMRKEAIYEHIGQKDVILNVIGNFPYTVEFRMRRTRELIGRTIDEVNTGDSEEYIITKYFIKQ